LILVKFSSTDSCQSTARQTSTKCSPIACRRKVLIITHRPDEMTEKFDIPRQLCNDYEGSEQVTPDCIRSGSAVRMAVPVRKPRSSRGRDGSETSKLPLNRCSPVSSIDRIGNPVSLLYHSKPQRPSKILYHSFPNTQFYLEVSLQASHTKRYFQTLCTIAICTLRV